VGNWKQVQARIRKARTGADAPAKLEQLFLKTRDGMVAFELAKVHEEGQREGDALDWYRKAFERFRRDEWRNKAAEAITRLGGTPPAVPETQEEPGEQEQAAPRPAPAAPAAHVPTPRSWAALPDQLYYRDQEPQVAGELPESEEEESMTSGNADEATETTETEITEAEPIPAGVSHESPQPGMGEKAAGGGKRRRRGRRGGRRHRRGGASDRPAGAAGQPHGAGQSQQGQAGGHSQNYPPSQPTRPEEHPQAPAPVPPRVAPPRPEGDDTAGWLGARAEEMRTRAGDPGLASRVARLEMQIRRLLACPPHKVSDGDLAPAGPGVLLLSDSDLTTHYYICACDTLRIEISRLTRSDRGGRNRGREGRPLRSQMADHLEISENQVSKYLESHCVVRWLQLDEGAPKVAHFATAVLDPILKEE